MSQKSLVLSTPKIMGILNITPDSFSDGGRFATPAQALDQVGLMLEQGVDIIDVGAESTRPNAKPVSDQEQLARLVPVVGAIKECYPNAYLSIDTSSPVVMAQMHSLGADMWNDVRGLQNDGAAQMAAKLDIPVVIMHHRGTPQTMDDLCHYDNVIAQVFCELKALTDNAISHGVKKERIVIDVGMGFAKDFCAHVALIKSLDMFLALGYPMLFGVSRKRFLGELMTLAGQDGSSITDRQLMGSATALLALQKGAGIIRTHDVASAKQVLTLWQQVK